MPIWENCGVDKTHEEYPRATLLGEGSIVRIVIYVEDMWDTRKGNWRWGILEMGGWRMVVINDAMRWQDQCVVTFMGVLDGDCNIWAMEEPEVMG